MYTTVFRLESKNVSKTLVTFNPGASVSPCVTLPACGNPGCPQGWAERLWRGCRTQPQACGCPLESPKFTWVWSVTSCSCNHSLTQQHPSLQKPGAGSTWPANALGHHCIKHSTWNSHWMRSRNPPGSGSADTPQAELWLRIPPVLSPGRASLTFLCVTASMTQSFLLLQPAFPPHLQPILIVAKNCFSSRWDVCALNFSGQDWARTRKCPILQMTATTRQKTNVHIK